ncbi:MAG TPA: transcriptional regulator [Brevundimonas sp.]|uniref:helix-turn-helix domain-containing protein n=1 Tax=Brevundimonas sp. TaxID=1871086 RepID=UPI002BD7E211|nr:transcriptional regulator [Brevundimonas sp.]HRH20310.1 transcriptional regulator [Brevundimonas sp.]
MDIRPIRNDEDHEAALREIEALWGAQAGTPEGDRLDVLITLADAYEGARWPIPEGDPVDAINGSMAMEGRTQSDLAEVLGSASRASEVLRRKRALTLPMIWALHEQWRIPAEVLVRPYRTAA